ncbi:MAG: TylF/MycF family methyltransferase [Saprospiraceae bacterium]|nr:TylF/MycF family methyltransferase [Saprospiraceae bacterium]
MSDNKLAYLELLKQTLTDFHRIDYIEYKPLIHDSKRNWRVRLLMQIEKILLGDDYTVCKTVGYNKEDRINGRDWPTYAESMIGLKRLQNIQDCAIDVLEKNVPGDFIETGVWRGGATVFMKAILNAYGIVDRTVWVADSFEGLPKPEKQYAADKGDKHHNKVALAISQEQVENNFKKYDLLDNRVKFLKGWFKDTLPSAPIEKLALLRLDGDMYQSTMDALINLYHKLSIGGYIIIDDWGAVPGCKQAVEEFRSANNITDPINVIDWAGVYWQKS